MQSVFSEPPVDNLYEEDFPRNDKDTVFSVEFLPGQFDQRADSAVQCIRFLKGSEDPIIRTAEVYCLTGDLTENEVQTIKDYVVNPVDSRIIGLDKPKTLVTKYDEPEDITCRLDFRPTLASTIITMDYSSGPLDVLENRQFAGSTYMGDDMSLPIRLGNSSGPLRTARRSNLSFYRLTGSQSDHGVFPSKRV
jgi:hypothetical protein